MTDTHPSLTLSALEQSGPRAYIRPLFFLSLKNTTDVQQNDAISLLGAALELTKKAIPFLAADLIPDTESQQTGRLKLQQNPESGKFYKKDLGGGAFPLSYKDLEEQHFPTSELSQEIFCPVPIFPIQASPIPVFTAQATLIDGGLVLNFCIMHLVADARAIHEILNTWAQNCRYLQDPQTTLACSHLPPSIFDKTQFQQGLETPGKHPEYVVFGSPPVPQISIPKSTFSTKVYRFSPESLAILKQDLTIGLGSGDEYILTAEEAIYTLIWRCVLAAQLNLATSSPDALSLNTINVNGRSRCLNPLPENHIGSPIIYATPGISILQMFSATGLIDAAVAIHGAMSAIDDYHIASLVGFLKQVHSYECIVPASFAGLMDTSVMMGSWLGIPFYDIYWGDVFGNGRFDSVRTVHEGFFDGTQVILPELRTGEIEVVVGLDVKDWDKFGRDKLWARYATV